MSDGTMMDECSRSMAVVMPEGAAITDRVRLNTWVKRCIWEGVNDISKTEDMSVSDVVRDALKDYIRKYKTRTKAQR